MTLAVEYPAVANQLGDGDVTQHMRDSIEEQFQQPETVSALASLMACLDATRVCVIAVETNGVAIHHHEPTQTVLFGIGRDVLESDTLEASLAFLPQYVYELIDTTTGESDSQDDDNDTDDMDAPLP